MRNFPIIVDNKEYWISRSVAVCGLIFTYDQGIRVLISQRGEGAADFRGKWNCPCGYLDFDETLAEACSREISEETNLYVNPKNLRFFSFNDDPKENKQNISFVYWAWDNYFYKGQTVYPKGTEENEVSDVKWIDLDSLDNYEWAFGHKYLIMQVSLCYLRDNMNEETVRRFKEQLKKSNILGTDA